MQTKIQRLNRRNLIKNQWKSSKIFKIRVFIKAKAKKISEISRKMEYRTFKNRAVIKKITNKKKGPALKIRGSFHKD
jgi:hypothetical protein